MDYSGHGAFRSSLSQNSLSNSHIGSRPDRRSINTSLESPHQLLGYHGGTQSSSVARYAPQVQDGSQRDTTVPSHRMLQLQSHRTSLQAQNFSMQDLYHPYQRFNQPSRRVPQQYALPQQQNSSHQHSYGQSSHQHNGRVHHTNVRPYQQGRYSSLNSPLRVPGPIRSRPALAIASIPQPQQQTLAKYPLDQARSTSNRPVAVIKESAKRQQMPIQSPNGLEPVKTTSPLPTVPYGADYIKIYPFTRPSTVDDSDGVNIEFKSKVVADDSHLQEEISRLNNSNPMATMSEESGWFGKGYHISPDGLLKPTSEPSAESVDSRPPRSASIALGAMNEPLTASMAEICPLSKLDEFLMDAAPRGTPIPFPKHNLFVKRAVVIPEGQLKAIAQWKYDTVRGAANVLARARYWASIALARIAEKRKQIQDKLKEEYHGSFKMGEDGVLIFEYPTGMHRATIAIPLRASSGPRALAFNSSSPPPSPVDSPLNRKSLPLLSADHSITRIDRSAVSQQSEEARQKRGGVDVEDTDHVRSLTTQEWPKENKSSASSPPFQNAASTPNLPRQQGLTASLLRARSDSGQTAPDSNRSSVEHTKEVWAEYLQECYKYRLKLCYSLNDAQARVWVAMSNNKRRADMPTDRVLRTPAVPKLLSIEVMDMLQRMHMEKSMLEDLGLAIMQRIDESVETSCRLKAKLDILSEKRTPYF